MLILSLNLKSLCTSLSFLYPCNQRNWDAMLEDKKSYGTEPVDPSRNYLRSESEFPVNPGLTPGAIAWSRWTWNRRTELSNWPTILWTEVGNWFFVWSHAKLTIKSWGQFSPHYYGHAKNNCIPVHIENIGVDEVGSLSLAYSTPVEQVFLFTMY